MANIPNGPASEGVVVFSKYINKQRLINVMMIIILFIMSYTTIALM